MCVLSIKVPIRKKSGNLFNDPRGYIYSFFYGALRYLTGEKSAEFRSQLDNKCCLCFDAFFNKSKTTKIFPSQFCLLVI